MARFKNVHPCGAVDYPRLGLHLEAGQEFDVTDESVIEQLTAQPDIYQPVTSKKKDA